MNGELAGACPEFLAFYDIRASAFPSRSWGIRTYCHKSFGAHLSPSSTELRRSGPMPEWQSQGHACRCLRLAPSDLGWCRPCYVSLLPSMGISPPVVHTPIAQ